MMNKKFKKKWVNALLSGKYKQGKDRLLDADGKYCCLGVACVEAGLAPEKSLSMGELIGYKFNGEVSFLPDALRRDMGIEGDDPVIRPKGADKSAITRKMHKSSPQDAYSLSELNDSGFSFKTIARLIDRYL